ncbi:MAG: polyprenol monophosphomannose synthase [Thermoguttaceae bacterium]|nr:polyprenol monophosphomannose synthase [Thermoguttaceae bacterium]MDW8078194.1 polyprenol monophosphomannose synthase [Thermoguttaceae bacterium]
MRRILVALATYNEMENLPSLLEEIWRVCPQADVLVVDDNSPDGTGRWCEAKAAHEPRLKVTHRPGKLGIGTAHLQAIRYAVEAGYDLLVTMDADWSHRPHHVPDLLSAMDPVTGTPVDVAIGSRYVRGGMIEGWPWFRRLMSWAINLYARWLLWLPVRDCSGAFRCYRVKTLAQLPLEEVRSQGFSFFEEILWRLRRRGARIVEVPIRFVERAAGHSKINWREGFEAAWLLLRLALTSSRRRR